jgi:hypothetical protein
MNAANALAEIPEASVCMAENTTRAGAERVHHRFAAEHIAQQHGADVGPSQMYATNSGKAKLWTVGVGADERDIYFPLN